MNTEVRTALRAITYDAKSRVHGDIYGLGNWQVKGKKLSARSSMFNKAAFPNLVVSEAKRGISYTTGKQKPNRRGFSAVYSILNKSRAGAIMEIAGRKAGERGNDPTESNNPNASKWFISRLNDGIGEVRKSNPKANRKHEGRLIFAAVQRNQGKARASIVKSVEKAEAQYKARAKAIR